MLAGVVSAGVVSVLLCWAGMPVLLCRAGLADLAAADCPAPWGAVSWALGGFTAEFGMGSGVFSSLCHQTGKKQFHNKLADQS